MPAAKTDESYLWDMLSYARMVKVATESFSREDYLHNRLRQLGIERAIEIIGEAARMVSRSFQQAHLEIAWRQNIAQRHVIAHDYGEVDHERIWGVATIHIPILITLLEPLVPPPPHS